MKKLFILLCAALLTACGSEIIPNANKVDGQYVGVLQTTSLTDGEVFAEKGVEFSLTPSALIAAMSRATPARMSGDTMSVARSG